MLGKTAHRAASRTAVAPLSAVKTKTPSQTTKQNVANRRFSGSTTNSKTNARLVDPSDSEAAGNGSKYLAATAASGLAGLALLLQPAGLWELLGSTDVVHTTITSTQVYAAYWLLSTTATYRLAKAADKGILSSSTYQRLNAFLAIFTAASAVPFLQGAAEGTLHPAPAVAVAAALATAAVGVYLPGYAAGSGTTDVGLITSGFGDALKTTIKAGRGLLGAFYSLSFWEAFILGTALIAGPILPTVAGEITGSTLLAKDIVGVGTLLYAGLIWALLDAADRGRLDAATFRALNAACGLVSVVVGVICILGQYQLGIDTNLTNQAVVLVSCTLTASVYLYQAVKPSSNE